jgi:MraZ protein
MFYGEYEHTTDRKGRLIIPAKFREIFKENLVERLFVTRGLDKCLFLFSEEEWKLQEQKFKSIPFTKLEARKFNRLYFSGASEVIPDKQGRILIPRNLKEFAGIKREVVIIGVSNRIEIWSKELWNGFYESSKESFEETAERLLSE